MKILILAAAALLLGGCATYPGYQYSNGYYRGQAEYNNGYPAGAYGSGYDAYGWPIRSAFYGGYGGYGYGGYGYGGYGYGTTTVIYDRSHHRHDRGHRGHWRGHDRRHSERGEHHHNRAPARAPVHHAPRRVRVSRPVRHHEVHQRTPRSGAGTSIKHR